MFGLMNSRMGLYIVWYLWNYYWGGAVRLRTSTLPGCDKLNANSLEERKEKAWTRREYHQQKILNVKIDDIDIEVNNILLCSSFVNGIFINNLLIYNENTNDIIQTKYKSKIYVRFESSISTLWPNFLKLALIYFLLIGHLLEVENDIENLKYSTLLAICYF